MLAAGLLHIRRLPGVLRPAIAVVIPARFRPSVLIDSGANADNRAEHLVQFGHMGSVFAQEILEVANPEVRLLSIGEEAEKGNQLTLEAHALLVESTLNFRGNTEGRDLLVKAADVVVTDGFTGNVALKTVEGAIRGTARLVFEALNSTPEVAKASEAVMPALLSAADTLDPDGEGGCVLLGIGGVCIISHGSSNARAIHSATRRAVDCVEWHVVDRVKEAIASAG
jgi:glycerol-3-phosphate acyltransferase PlsX